MRIAPFVLIAIGSFGLARYFDWIPHGALHLLGPLLLIGVGVALLFRRPRRGCGPGRGRDERPFVDASKASSPASS